MMSPDTLDALSRRPLSTERRAFVDAFVDSGNSRPKLIFGRNVYTNALVQGLKVDGVVDDYCQERSHLGVPIVRSADIPKNALVLAVAGGRPLTVKAWLDTLGIANLDYFAFRHHAPLELPELVFNAGFAEDFRNNAEHYRRVHDRFADDLSREIFRKLVAFRYTSDIQFLAGFTQNEHNQYFEAFLGLLPDGEVFYDVGCFDGATSLVFASRYPGYRAIEAFEPEEANWQVCSRALARLEHARLHRFGLASKSTTVSFKADGSASAIEARGAQTVNVVALDSLSLEAPTFLKVDIEGGEPDCLAGARETIARHRPALAIAVYHYTTGSAPFWQVPEQVLGLRDDYDVYLRHYTESIYETDMFFVPR
jgi:FkbM family methyltransferase